MKCSGGRKSAGYESVQSAYIRVSIGGFYTPPDPSKSTSLGLSPNARLLYLEEMLMGKDDAWPESG